jgi:hypothetical protein
LMRTFFSMSTVTSSPAVWQNTYTRHLGSSIGSHSQLALQQLQLVGNHATQAVIAQCAVQVQSQQAPWACSNALMSHIALRQSLACVGLLYHALKCHLRRIRRLKKSCPRAAPSLCPWPTK